MADITVTPGRSDRPRRWSSDRAFSVLVVAASAVLSALITFLLFASPFQRDVGDTSSPPRGDAAEAAAQPHSAAAGRHVNEAGGYSFLHPQGWTVNERGTVSELVSAGGDVVISFGQGRDGSLRTASAALVRSIERRYQGVDLHPPQTTTVDGHPAAVVGGRLVNDEDASVRFLGIALRAGGENHVIGVFVSRRVEPRDVLTSVEQVVASFEPA